MKILQLRLRTMLLAIIPIALFCALAAAVGRERREIGATICLGNMSQMADLLLDYRERHGHYPPATFKDQSASLLHSWRPLLWQELFHSDTQNLYNLTQPWNSPGNLAWASGRHAPMSHACPNNQSFPPRYTNYVALIDRGVPSLERAEKLVRGSPEEARHVLIIEYPNSDIPWSEPRNLDIHDLDKLTEGADPGLGVIFADAHYQRVSLAELRNLLSHASSTEK